MNKDLSQVVFNDFLRSVFFSRSYIIEQHPRSSGFISSNSYFAFSMAFSLIFSSLAGSELKNKFSKRELFSFCSSQSRGVLGVVNRLVPNVLSTFCQRFLDTKTVRK